MVLAPRPTLHLQCWYSHVHTLQCLGSILEPPPLCSAGGGAGVLGVRGGQVPGQHGGDEHQAEPCHQEVLVVLMEDHHSSHPDSVAGELLARVWSDQLQGRGVSCLGSDTGILNHRSQVYYLNKFIKNLLQVAL